MLRKTSMCRENKIKKMFKEIEKTHKRWNYSQIKKNKKSYYWLTALLNKLKKLNK